jgi:predicted amidohydrolase
MAGKKISLGLVQMRMSGSKEENLDRALSMVGTAAKRGAGVVCLPELFNAPYFAQWRGKKGRDALGLAESIPGPVTGALSRAAKEHGVAIVGGSIYEKSGRSLYNTSVVFSETGRLLGKYRKMHIPQDECFFEKDYFSKGDLGFRSFTAASARIGVLICFDQWFPEAARSVALLGADVLFYPTAIGTVRGIAQAEGDWHAAWENAMRGHAIANAMPVAAVNRCGTEGKMRFWGGSFICDAFGKTIARAGSGEQVIVAGIDTGHSEMVREGWGFFRNRRPDAYNLLVKRK